MNVKAKSNQWWDIRDNTNGITEVFIYDEIGDDWLGNSVSAKTFINEISQVRSPEIHLRINSPGGSVFDAHAIHNALTRHPSNVTTFIDGLAASAASFVALAGQRVVMAKNALFMIHNPWGGVSGTADDMRQMADVLDKVKTTIVDIYQTKTGLPTEALSAAMNDETWYTADEAMRNGFVDEISNALAIAASFNLDTLRLRCKSTDKLTILEPVDDLVSAGSDETDTGGAPNTHPTLEAVTDTYIPGVGFTSFRKENNNAS